MKEQSMTRNATFLTMTNLSMVRNTHFLHMSLMSYKENGIFVYMIKTIKRLAKVSILNKWE